MSTRRAPQPIARAWQATIEAAEEANEPGRFTAFIGYEWTSNTGGNNLHRNVIFRDDGDKASQVEPYTVYPPRAATTRATCGSGWTAYENEDRRPRARASRTTATCRNGRMFPLVESFTGKPIDREYAETARAVGAALRGHPDQGRRRGASRSSRPTTSSPSFERWDKGNLDLQRSRRRPEMLEFEYARSALKNGLKLEAELGTNPYKFGLIGSSDAHTGLAAVEEDNFFGKTTPQEPSPERLSHPSSRARRPA